MLQKCSDAGSLTICLVGLKTEAFNNSMATSHPSVRVTSLSRSPISVVRKLIRRNTKRRGTSADAAPWSWRMENARISSGLLAVAAGSTGIDQP